MWFSVFMHVFYMFFIKVKKHAGFAAVSFHLIWNQHRSVCSDNAVGSGAIQLSARTFSHMYYGLLPN